MKVKKVRQGMVACRRDPSYALRVKTVYETFSRTESISQAPLVGFPESSPQRSRVKLRFFFPC